MISIQSYVRQGQHTLRQWTLDPKIHGFVRGLAHGAAGFCLSAASLANSFLPLVVGLVFACSGWACVWAALGGAAGYLVFWSGGTYQPLVWTAAALALRLLLAERRFLDSAPLLQPAVAAMIVAVSGVVFQGMDWGSSPVSVYLLRVGLGFACTWLLGLVAQGRNPLLDWMAWGLGVLALAQIMPIPYLGLGYIAAGAMVSAASFPAAALAGLALDLAQVTSVPMAAVMALSYLVRFLPRYPKWIARLCPGVTYLGVMALCGRMDLQPLPGLVLGGILGSFLPLPAKANHRRGETGAAQVRLEIAAGVLIQTEQMLLEAPAVPLDDQALTARAAERACGGCPCRKSCKDTARLRQLPGSILYKQLLQPEELPVVCRKSGRVLTELHRSQEQLRAIQADRQRQGEYRAAVIQQYRFLAEFLQDLSDQLARRESQAPARFCAEVSVFSNRTESENGDLCYRFAGVGGRYYVVLCDGMGTGLGAAQEGRNAGSLLRRMLSAGYPAEYALRSLNSLCALRDRAGAVTVDMAEIRLDSGKVTLYKWGAPPSFLVSTVGAERLGMVSPPPGISVTAQQEQTDRFSLRREQQLVMVSDGIGSEEALRCCLEHGSAPKEELANRLLTCCDLQTADDATVVLVCLEKAEAAP